MTRIQPDRGLQRRERSLIVLRPPARRAEMILGVEEVRLERDRLREQFERFRRPALLSADEAESIVRLGVGEDSARSRWRQIGAPAFFSRPARQKARCRRGP